MQHTKILFIILFLSVKAIGQVWTVPNTVVPYSSVDFISPGRGANTFFNDQQKNPLPDDANGWADDNHIRHVWSKLQPTSAGVYDWTAFDAGVASCISKGHQLMSFGIITVSKEPADGAVSVGGAYIGYPLYVHTAMQGETNKDWIIDGYWIPNWNSNNYLTAFETFMTALAAHVATASVSGIRINIVNDKLDLLGYGIYGEWHTSGIGRDNTGLGSCLYTHACGPTGTVATIASLKRIVDAQKNAFPNTSIRAVTNAFITYELPAEIGHYILTSSNSVGRFGWGTYHLGSTASYYVGYSEANTVVFAGDSLRPLIMNRWKEAPIFGELLPSNQGEVTKGGIVWGDLETQVRLYHISQFNNNWNYGSNSHLVVRAASKASGYRLQYAAGGTLPDSIRPNTVFPVRMIWQNVGIAPLYRRYNVVYEFRQAGVVKLSFTSTFNPQYFLPGTITVTDNYSVPSLPAGGSYDLYVIFRDINGYTPPIVIANTGRQGDGSYLIRSGIRVGVNGSTPPPPPPPPPNIPPSAYAGSDISDTLPVTTDTLRGIVSDANGDAVTVSWVKLSGPSVTIATPTQPETILTGLSAGTYTFRLTANDGHGGLASDDLNLFLVDALPPDPPPPPPPIYNPPTISIRGDTVVQYTADSAYLIGHVLTKDTAIQSVQWILYSYSGTTVGTIVNASDSTTKVTGLTPGIYQYRFKVIDKAGNEVIADGFRRVIVLPVIPEPLPLPGPPGPIKVFGIKKPF